MGKRGPAPKPTVLKLIDGTQRDRINFDEPIAASELPECPEGASDDVREIWDYTVHHLAIMHLAKAPDRDALFCYCTAVVNHRKASAVMASSPILIKGIMGGLVRNPALTVQYHNAHIVRQFAQEFGLTPSARSAITVAGKKDGTEDAGNPFAATG